MQRYPQTPQGQRPVARPQQGGAVQRPSAGPAPQRAPGSRPVSGAAQPNYSRQPAPQRPQPVQRPAVPRQSAQRPMPNGSRPMPAASPQRRPAPAGSAPQQAVRRPAAPAAAFTGRTDNRPLIIAAACMVVTLLIGCLMQYVFYPDGFFPNESAKAVTAVAEIASSRGVRINEVMTSNKSALSDDKGNSPDWIELVNASGQAVDISGWSLLDKTSRSVYFTFPSYRLEPDETVIVFASGQLASENGAAFHAPFRLSSAGDTLLLSDEHGTVVEAINIPALGANQSYARQDGGWSITSEYTPYLANTSVNYAAITSTQPMADSPLIISEVMADNASYPAADGIAYDYIEIRNTGSQAVSLAGYALSDSAEKPSQWKFPDMTLEPGQCLLVYASGLDGLMDDGTLHAGFGLRAEGESVLLYNHAGQVLDHVEFDNLKTDQSIQRQSDGSYTTSATPTPGQAN